MKIGFTGHRLLDDPGAWDWVEAALDRELEAMGRPVIGISSLAIGGDQLFSSLVARRGGKIHAVIPFADYERTFSEEEIDGYRKLLAMAVSVEVLVQHGTDEDSFMAVGRRAVELADILIAVWDGRPAKGIGGTGDVVAYARSLGRPVVQIDPVGRRVLRNGLP